MDCILHISYPCAMCENALVFVTLVWLENPQIPAATSMANMISRKKKNCVKNETNARRNSASCYSLCLQAQRSLQCTVVRAHLHRFALLLGDLVQED